MPRQADLKDEGLTDGTVETGALQPLLPPALRGGRNYDKKRFFRYNSDTFQSACCFVSLNPTAETIFMQALLVIHGVFSTTDGTQVG